MKIAKKSLMIGTIVATGIASLLLILLIFDINIFGNGFLSVLITFASLSIGGFFAINSLNMVAKNKIIGWISVGLISASVFLIILSSWVDLSGIVLDITLSIGLLSVLFNIIVSSGLELGKKKLSIQIIVYVLVAITDVIATLGILGAIKISSILEIFLVLIILSVVGVVVLKILGKKLVADTTEESKDTIRISKAEYDLLVEKAKMYDSIISEKSQE